MEDITMLFQRVARETAEAGQPTAIIFGTVESIAPLEIMVDQKLRLHESQLYLTSNVKDSVVDITTNYNGTKNPIPCMFHNALKVGEQVLMLRNLGGQMYVVLDKVVDE